MYSFWGAVLRPYPLLFLVTGVALAALWRRRQAARGRLLLASIGFAVLALVSTPLVSQLLLATLEQRYPSVKERPPGGAAIVVLSAGLVYPDADGKRVEIDQDTRLRCVQAARLYRQGPPCPVIVSGGRLGEADDGPTCASLMYDYLLREGVKGADIVQEGQSRTTYENAVECRGVLEKRGLRKVILVTDAVDMLRAERCFQKQGIECLPAPSRYRYTGLEWSASLLLPSPGAARGSERVWHEWVGMVWYRLWGRI